MGNTVGSANTDFWNLKTKDDAYIIGLWCADGYYWTSSIGISNTDSDLIEKFREFFLRFFPADRLKIMIYYPDKFKRRTKAYHLYVNSRPLLRKFREFKDNATKFINRDLILPYLAGRFDGDGSVAKEAQNDLALVLLLGFQKMKIYNYRTAKTFCLYFSRLETNKFLSLIYPYSVRLQKSVFVPRRDLTLAKAKRV